MSIDIGTEQTTAPAATVPTSAVPDSAVDPKLRRRRRLIIAMALTLALAVIVAALVVFGVPSTAAPGGCGGGG